MFNKPSFLSVAYLSLKRPGTGDVRGFGNNFDGIQLDASLARDFAALRLVMS
jgi:hypothetical protein